MMQVDITGIPNLKKNMDGFIDDKEFEQVMVRQGLILEGDAKMICTSLKAVDTGRLRSSISTNWDSNSQNHGQVEAPADASEGVSRPRKSSGDLMVVRVGTNVKYAPYVHEGTSRMPARPFMDIAVMRNMSRIQQSIQQFLDERAGKV